MSNNSSTIDNNNGLDYILLFRLIVWGYIGMILSVFGILGNIITILVLISPSMRTTSTNIYLTALSCSNILFLLIFIPPYSMKYLLGYRLYMSNHPSFPFETLLLRLPTTPIYNTILLSIIYLTVAVSMDRLILVKFPLKAKQILTQRTTLIAILLIYIFSIVYCIPYWFEQRYSPELRRCYLTDIGKQIYKYTRIYIYIPVVYLIPFITLTCINVTIIQNLIAQKHRKKSLGAKTSKKKQADHYITLMLVTVIIVFVLSQLPLLILNAWYAIDPMGSMDNLLFHSLNIIGVLLVVFNTSTNFLLYCFFGQKFRETLIQFIFHLFPNHSKQTNLQTRIAKLAKKDLPTSLSPQTDIQITYVKEKHLEFPLPSPSLQSIPESKINISTDNCFPTNNLQRCSLNQNLEESCPLITNSKPLTIVNENFPFKPDQKLNLYTCTNGKRLLILKI